MTANATEWATNTFQNIGWITNPCNWYVTNVYNGPLNDSLHWWEKPIASGWFIAAIVVTFVFTYLAGCYFIKPLDLK